MVAPYLSNSNAFTAAARLPEVQPTRWRARCLLRLAAFCAIGGLAACKTTTAPQTALTHTAASPTSRQISPARREAIRLDQLPPLTAPRIEHPPVDSSGRKETGEASFYARGFDGRKTADGQRFNPDANTAASKTLPIGTTAKVVNLATGKTATVTVNDRGPYVAGRMLDVSPKVAAKLDMKQAGVTRVVVAPISVPQKNGTVKLGAGAATAAPSKIMAAVRTTKQVAAHAGDKTTDNNTER